MTGVTDGSVGRVRTVGRRERRPVSEFVPSRASVAPSSARSAGSSDAVRRIVAPGRGPGLDGDHHRQAGEQHQQHRPEHPRVVHRQQPISRATASDDRRLPGRTHRYQRASRTRPASLPGLPPQAARAAGPAEQPARRGNHGGHHDQGPDVVPQAAEQLPGERLGHLRLQRRLDDQPGPADGQPDRPAPAWTPATQKPARASPVSRLGAIRIEASRNSTAIHGSQVPRVLSRS